MRIAAFNVENLFDRTKAFGMTIRNYTAGDKNKMLDLMDQLGVLNRDEGRFVRIRKIRGQLIKRPHDKNKPREIVAKGRQDWAGWCELKTASVNEVAVVNTGRVMRDLEADILAVVEVESRPVLY
ncbi:MAG: endonuclease/exonuclease/phosphatase family protein, partial [Sphingomonadales bacterium]